MLCLYILPWLVIETHGTKLSKIAISYYQNIACGNVSYDMGILFWTFESENKLAKWFYINDVTPLGTGQIFYVYIS